MKPFDIIQLPLQGIQLIEASAGTGKTYSMTQIYLRLLLQKKLNVEQILVMSFTQAATAEIKARIEQALNHIFQHWQDPHESDPFFCWLYRQIEANQAKKIIRQALLSLDIAPIQTIHSFCHRILHHYALQTDKSLESNLTELYLQAVRDYYRRHRHSDLQKHWSSPDKFYQQFSALIHQNSDYRVLNLQQLTAEAQALRQNILAHQTEIEERLIQAHRLKRQRAEEWQPIADWLVASDPLPLPDRAFKTFFSKSRRPRKMPLSSGLSAVFDQVAALLDDQKSILKQQDKYQLAAQAIDAIRQMIAQEKEKQKKINFNDLIQQVSISLKKRKALADQLFQQYPAALVDEFQDTDQQQFNILQILYMQAPRRQQASLYMIGDPKQSIYAFRGGDIFAYLAARKQVDQIWSMNINWRSNPALVQAYNHLFLHHPNCFGKDIIYHRVKPAKELPSLKDPEGQQALIFMHYEPEEDEKEAQIKTQIAQACANEINRLLEQNIRIGDQIIQPRDIVILVRNRGEAQYIEDSLKQAGLSAVYLSQRERLFQSPQAKQLLTALKGIFAPEEESLFRAALTTPYLGADLQLIAGLNQNISLWESWYRNLKKLREDWYKKGFMSMALTLLHRYYQPTSDENLERSLTNSLHLIEVLQEYSRRHHAQPTQLMRWFTEQIYHDSSELELRLESEENLLRIQTQHGAKGLQYPIVFIPFAAFELQSRRAQSVFCFHENERLVYQLGKLQKVMDKVEQEALWENNRLFYVAVTRAIHRCYIYSTSLKKQARSPLAQVLNQSDVLSSLQALVKKQPDAIALRTSILPYHAPLQMPERDNSRLQAAKLRPDFHLQSYRIKSFSSLVWHNGNLSIPDRDQDDSAVIPDEQEQLRFRLRAGIATGHLLHGIMERLDFKQPNWQNAIQVPLARYGHLPAGFDTQDLIQWLQDIIQTPLHGFCLADIAQHHTLREIEFYYATHAHNDIKQLLAEYGLSIDKLSLGQMMNGYIDLIFEHQGRYYIADYKSNYLGSDYGAYQMPYLEQNMRAHHYDIQALIYAIALHRHLRRSLPDYQPEHHFGGVYYFYLRGMHPDQKTGVYFKKTDPEFLQAWDQILSP